MLVSGLFSITITFVFFSFNSIPKPLHTLTILSNILCKSCVLLASITVSSAERLFVNYFSLITMPFSFSRAFFITSSLYILNNISDKIYLCVTPCFIFTFLDSEVLILICASWLSYMFYQSNLFVGYIIPCQYPLTDF